MKKIQIKNVWKVTALSLALVLLASTLLLIPADADAADTSALGSLIDKFSATTNNTAFTLSTSSRFFIVTDAEPSEDLVSAIQLAQQQFAAAGFPSGDTMKIVWGDDSMALAGDILIVLDTASSLVDDGYQLNVATTATVTAKNIRGLHYGLNALLKHFRNGGKNSIKGFTAQDEPDTKERTVHLDLARKYYTVEWVCNFIRQISWMGYNALELHTSEDGGFRADLWDSKYYTDNYEPENDFSWLCGSHVQSWVKDPYRTDPNAGDYLTTAELVQICNVAKEYHIEIIPSFDSPAHMDYITWKFEQNYKTNNAYSFKYNGTTYKASSNNGCINFTNGTGGSSPDYRYAAFNISNAMAKAFVFTIYKDMAAFFKEYAGSTKFNIGADEVALGNSTTWNYSAFPGYINDLNRMLNGMGYTVRMYNDFIGSTTYNQEYDPSEGISAYNSVYDFDDNIEICYWTSDFHPSTGKFSEATWHCKFFWENNTGTTDNWGDGGRTMYNCIQTHTYYVLRIGTSGDNRDARDPDNRNWTFYRTNEEAIYNEWYPADISEKGDYPEDAADVPADQLGGAYFLIWNDYAALNTEQEVWNGAQDGWDKDRYYYLFDIMASNIIKMWNADIDSTVTYSAFAALRDKMGDFPGLVSGTNGCSTDPTPTMPTATAPIQLISQNTMKTEIGSKVAQGIYTDESYSAYSAAYDEAYAIATATTLKADQQYKIPELISNVKTTKAALTIKTFTITINHYLEDTQTPVKDTEIHSTTTETNHYSITVPSINRYSITSIDGTTGYTQDTSGVTFTGDATGNLVITIYYKALIDTSALEVLIANGDALNSVYYTTDTWTAYEKALAAAKAVAANPNATQEQVDTATAALKAASEALEAKDDPKKTPLTVELLNDCVPIGKQVGFRITSEASVETLTITCNGKTQAPIFCSSQVQTLIDGDMVKIWLVFLKADTAGSFTYTINGTVDVAVTIVAPASN